MNYYIFDFGVLGKYVVKAKNLRAARKSLKTIADNKLVDKHKPKLLKFNKGIASF